MLGTGVAIILFTLFASTMIFTGESPAPEVFSAPETALRQTGSQPPGLLGEQLQGLLPQDAIPQMLNFFVWSMLAGLLMLGGSLIAGIGVKLAK